jgi:predicted restriction endonuclease
VQYKGSANVDNLTTLCDNHHKKVHEGKIDITKF